MNVVLFVGMNPFRKRCEINVIEAELFNNIYYDSENESNDYYMDNAFELLEEVEIYKTLSSITDLLFFMKDNQITVTNEIYYNDEY